MCDNLCWPFYLVSIMSFKMRHLWSCSLICSIFRKICCKPDIPAPNEEKPQQVKYIPSSFTQLFFIQLIMITNHFLMCAVKQFLGDDYFQPHDPEELQPYASYVQRVNSIYNSSAELFNAWITPDLHECTDISDKSRSLMCLRCHEVCTREMHIHQCTPTLWMKLHTSTSTAVNESWWNLFKRTSSIVQTLMRETPTRVSQSERMSGNWRIVSWFGNVLLSVQFTI